MTPGVRVAKRAIDIAGSLVGLTLTLPLYPLIGAAIYLESPGPIFYMQRRAGMLIGTEVRDGVSYPRFVEFHMRKFRSMRVDAEKMTGPVLAQQDDPRITRVGRFLRKTRLDEIPQFWSVLMGDMSIVGPRPERPELLVNLALAIPFFEERMRDIKPGITGLAQVSLGYTGRAPAESEVAAFEATLTNPFGLEEAEGAEADDMRMKLLFDLAYAASLEKLSTFLSMELSIILKTPLVMVLGLGR
ncbi:glycosyl transferase [Sorangium cellulosum]|uniref:Glycosyl transferase n=1 Tax=Sorangium cellulosum TaxID=56 RepID=A0A150TRF6_SORCE|nr:glycosyl transferase [Sorangium cellulosum]